MTAKFFLTYGDLQVHAPESPIRDFGKEIFTPNWSINNRPIDFRNGRIPNDDIITEERITLENTMRIDLFRAVPHNEVMAKREERPRRQESQR